MTVARMVYLGLPDKKIWGVGAVKLTVVFVWLDIVCFLVQLGGGVLLSNNDDAGLTRVGMKVYTAGIGLQLGLVVIFGTMTAWFWRRMRRVSRGQSMGGLRFLIWTMLAVLVLIMASQNVPLAIRRSRRCRRRLTRREKATDTGRWW